jgi:hypothetical protein
MGLSSAQFSATVTHGTGEFISNLPFVNSAPRNAAEFLHQCDHKAMCKPIAIITA